MMRMHHDVNLRATFDVIDLWRNANTPTRDDSFGIEFENQRAVPVRRIINAKIVTAFHILVRRRGESGIARANLLGMHAYTSTTRGDVRSSTDVVAYKMSVLEHEGKIGRNLDSARPEVMTGAADTRWRTIKLAIPSGAKCLLVHAESSRAITIEARFGDYALRRIYRSRCWQVACPAEHA